MYGPKRKETVREGTMKENVTTKPQDMTTTLKEKPFRISEDEDQRSKKPQNEQPEEGKNQ